MTKIREVATVQILLLAIMVFVQGGCDGTSRVTSVPLFSKDGQHVAYVYQDALEELGVDDKAWFRTLHLRWCRVDDPAEVSSVLVERLGARFAGYGTVGCDVQWSPDGSHIGVLTPHKLLIVEISTKKKIELRDGTITSFAWQSDRMLAYHASRSVGEMSTRIVARIDLETRQETDAYVFPKRPKELSIGAGHWSPSGKFLIVMEPSSGGQYYCVNTSDGTAQAFGQRGVHIEGVAWTPDSSRVFCVSNEVGPGYRYEATLLDPETGTTVDCSNEFQATFAGQWTNIEPLWTADGKYVIVNAQEVHGHLVQPVPWRAIPLGATLAPRFSPPTQWSSIRPYLYRLPVPGWVLVIPTGGYGDASIIYASDYSGSRLKPFLQAYPGAMSPDGTMGVTTRRNGTIRIHKLGQWWLPAADSPSQGTGQVPECPSNEVALTPGADSSPARPTGQ